MSYKILGSIWYTPPQPSYLMGDMGIGVVAIESYIDGSWKVYIGYGLGIEEEADTQSIAKSGMPIGNRDAACGFFPQLDPELFRF